jgi:hypothetical protein
MPRIKPAAFDALRYAAQMQDGLITLRQAREIGIAPSTICDRAGPGGPWQRVLPAVYALFSGPLPADTRLRAALLYGGADSCTTGVEVLRRHGVPWAPRDPRVHLLIPNTQQTSSRGFVVVERTRRMPTPERLDGFPAAPLPRAILDATRRMRDQRAVTALITGSVQSGRCSAADLVAELADGQRRGTARARRAIDAALLGAASAPEADAQVLLRHPDLPEPLWNPVLRDAATGAFIASPDAYWKEGVALEVDSRAHHTVGDDFDRTLDRDALMTSYGLSTLHVTPARLRRDPQTLILRLLATLEIARSRPMPAVTVWRNSGEAL